VVNAAGLPTFTFDAFNQNQRAAANFFTNTRALTLDPNMGAGEHEK
jgi:hypothetical protein